MKKIISLITVFLLTLSIVGLSVGATQTDATENSDNSGISMPFFENMGTVFDFLKNGLNDITVYLEPVEGSTVSEFHVKYTENDGTVRDMPIYNYYDSKTGEVFGFNYDQGVFDSGFGYNAHSKTFYAMNGCWQRQFGFTPAYDIAAKAIGFDYATRRIFFDYDGKEWMIQIWKGNYAWNMLVGAEIGIYNRPEGTVNGLYFNCAQDDEMMPISMLLYDNEKIYVNRPAINTWWMTGFVLSEKDHNPYALTLESDIEFPNEEMCDAFVKSANVYTDISCSVDGTTANLRW